MQNLNTWECCEVDVQVCTVVVEVTVPQYGTCSGLRRVAAE